jgi:hypothetical protein
MRRTVRTAAREKDWAMGAVHVHSASQGFNLTMPAEVGKVQQYWHFPQSLAASP